MMNWPWDPPKPRQHTFVYCPNCRNEMVGDQRTEYADRGLVVYLCARCGYTSSWDFDTPAPIYMFDERVAELGWVRKVSRDDALHSCQMPVLRSKDAETHWRGTIWRCAGCKQMYAVTDWIPIVDGEDRCPVWEKVWRTATTR